MGHECFHFLLILSDAIKVVITFLWANSVEPQSGDIFCLLSHAAICVQEILSEPFCILLLLVLLLHFRLIYPWIWKYLFLICSTQFFCFFFLHMNF